MTTRVGLVKGDDRFATVLGFRPQQVGYLVYSVEDGYGTADLSQIEIVGTPIAEASFPLKPPPRLEVLLDWRA